MLPTFLQAQTLSFSRPVPPLRHFVAPSLGPLAAAESAQFSKPGEWRLRANLNQEILQGLKALSKDGRDDILLHAAGSVYPELSPSRFAQTLAYSFCFVSHEELALRSLDLSLEQLIQLLPANSEWRVVPSEEPMLIFGRQLQERTLQDWICVAQIGWIDPRVLIELGFAADRANGLLLNLYGSYAHQAMHLLTKK